MIWLLLACGGTSPENRVRSEEHQNPVEIQTVGGKYRLTWQSLPSPVPMGDLFVVETTLKDKDGKTIENGTVRVDARMPAHGHGMATRPLAALPTCTGAQEEAALRSTLEAGSLPEGCSYPGGKYKMEGMKFHMPGEWTLRFDVTGPAGADHAELRYAL
ncbi:MAG TPA: hypothetical protein PLA94_10880 [Myxococcota bacterium]|nr:hypothetical protein [Myxococcota bacterium]